MSAAFSLADREFICKPTLSNVKGVQFIITADHYINSIYIHLQFLINFLNIYLLQISVFTLFLFFVFFADDYVNIQTFSLTSLFPPSRDVFYRYYGSLTTPPCYESVIWTIFQEHIKISERQVCVIFLFDSKYVCELSCILTLLSIYYDSNKAICLLG